MENSMDDYSDDGFDPDERNDIDRFHPDVYNDYAQQMQFYHGYNSFNNRHFQRTKVRISCLLSDHRTFQTRRRRWTQRDMTNAYNAVKFQGMSLRGAATAYNVPESTLRDRVHGRVSLECSRPGPPTFFTTEEEKKMVDHILFMSKIGYPYTRNQVVELAGDMTKAVGRIAPFKYLNPSQAWFYAFLGRWPDLKSFLFGPRSSRKSKGVSGESIQAYFDQLDMVLTKYGIKNKPEHFWIVDEVSISCENQPPRILPISIQRAQSVSFWNPTVTMLGASNGAGEKIPPFLIYRGDSITSNMMEGAVRGSKFTSSDSGWVNSDTFIQWFFKHFRPLVNLRPLILFYDGHLQFVSVRVLERAREDDVLLFPLPPHPAYNHCVENTCFCAFQNYFKKRLDRFFDQNPHQPMIRDNAAPVLTHAYERALQPNIMTSLFERLGICPFTLSTSIEAYINMPDDYDSLGMVVDAFDNSVSYNNFDPSMHWPAPRTSSMYNSNTPFYISSTNNGKPPHDDESRLQLATRLPSDVASSRQAVVTQVNASGKSVTIRMHGPGASAIQPVSGDKSNTSTTTIVPTSGPSPDHQYQPIEVDISHEEEVGSDPPTSSSAGVVLMPGASGSDEIAEDSAAPDFCSVCGQLEPPEMTNQPDQGGNDSLQVVDWAQCGFCQRWVHLNGRCCKGSVVAEDSFICVFCRREGAVVQGRTNGIPRPALSVQ